MSTNGERPLEVTKAMTEFEGRLDRLLARLLHQHFEGRLSSQQVAGVLAGYAYRIAFPDAGNVSVSFGDNVINMKEVMP
jgi:hypothetical protein